jgi:hypothetical protein
MQKLEVGNYVRIRNDKHFCGMGFGQVKRVHYRNRVLEAPDWVLVEEIGDPCHRWNTFFLSEIELITDPYELTMLAIEMIGV